MAQAYELASGVVITASLAHQEAGEGMDAFIKKRDRPGRSRQQRRVHHQDWHIERLGTQVVAGAGDFDDLAGRRDQRRSGA